MSFGKPPTLINQKAKKQEIADKVKEIKERQQNWLKQRDQHKKDDKTPGKSTTSLNSYSKTKENNVFSGKQRHFAEDRHTSKNDTKTENSLSVEPRGKFKHWLEARNKAKNESNDMDQRLDTAQTYVLNADVLKVDSQRSSGFATPDIDYNDYARQKQHSSSISSSIYTGYADRDRTETAERLLSHQDFDAMADSIVARVKNDLNLGQSSTSSVSHKTETRKNKYSDMNTGKNSYSSGFGNKAVVENIKQTGNNNIDTSTHHCSSCHNLMMSPSNIPMIFIPCGHTICQACCQEHQLCPSCGCRPSSKTCNIMLLQIIQDYHGKGHQGNSKNPKFKHSSRSYSPENYRDIKPDTGIKTKAQYREEYQNLLTRQSVLKSEAGDIQGNIKDLTQQIKQEQKQIQSISIEENKVTEQIRAMQEKLDMLQEHRNQFTRSKEELDQKKTSEANRLNLVKDTLISLEIEIEKVKLLAEGR